MSNKQAVLKLLTLLKVHKKVIAMIVACLLLSTGLNLYIPLLSRSIMDDGFIGGDHGLLIRLVLYSLLIFVLSLLLNYYKEIKRVEISAKIQYKLSEESFIHLMKLKAGFFDNRNYAELLNNLNADVGSMTSIADESVFFVVTQAFSMLGAVIGLFLLDYRMTFLVLLFIPVKYVIMRCFAKKNKQFMNVFITENQEYAKWFGDTVGGVREVKVFGILEHKKKEFADRETRVVQGQRKMNMLHQLNRMTDMILVQFLITCIYLIGSNLVFDLRLSVGSVFAFITYSSYVTGPISAILNIGYLLSGIIPSTKRYYEFMALAEEDAGTDDKAVPTFFDLELQNMSFAYEKEKPVLGQINCEIEGGSKVAIIGKNGSGKSTLIDLLLRMYEPSEGKILLGGRDILSIPLEVYRSLISVVSQEVYLFNTSIRENICLYQTISEPVLLEMCRECGLGEFIDEVSPDYIVGQNGKMLSGGQRQKIALVRALLHDCPIMIFDEATSSADSYSEQQINSLLHTRLRDKTVIVVTHRTEILDEADQVVALDGGRLI